MIYEGLLLMLKKYLHRFTEFKQKQNVKKANLIGYLFNYLVCGASIRDYFMYELYNKSIKEKNEWVTCKRHIRIQKVSNDPAYTKFFSEKSLFNKQFEPFLKRKWIDLDQCSVAEFEGFVTGENSFFLKPKNGAKGAGVKKVLVNETSDIQTIVNEYGKKGYLAEETVEPTEELSAFNPRSLNTIRITACRNKNTGSFEIISAELRIGVTTDTDNFSTGGIVAGIDIATGKVITDGVSVDNRRYQEHPVSKKRIKGFQIPEWKSVLEFVHQLNSVCPQIGYVGWDIGIGKNKGLLVIEGNDCADHDVQQLPYDRGLWKEYKRILNL